VEEEKKGTGYFSEITPLRPDSLPMATADRIAPTLVRTLLFEETGYR